MMPWVDVVFVLCHVHINVHMVLLTLPSLHPGSSFVLYSTLPMFSCTCCVLRLLSLSDGVYT